MKSSIKFVDETCHSTNLREGHDRFTTGTMTLKRNRDRIVGYPLVSGIDEMQAIGDRRPHERKLSITCFPKIPLS